MIVCLKSVSKIIPAIKLLARELVMHYSQGDDTSGVVGFGGIFAEQRQTITLQQKVVFTQAFLEQQSCDIFDQIEITRFEAASL